jgi:hypothetical protein
MERKSILESGGLAERVRASAALWSEIEVQDDVARIVWVGLYGGGGLLKSRDAYAVGDDTFEVADELVLLHIPTRHGDGVLGNCRSTSVGVCVGWRKGDRNEVLAIESDFGAGPVLGELLDYGRLESRVGRLAEVESEAIVGLVATEPHVAQGRVVRFDVRVAEPDGFWAAGALARAGGALARASGT